MASLKFLGLDSFSACFYQAYWHIIGEKVCYAVLNFLNDSVHDRYINYTYLVLIPKIPNPVWPSDFWLISLCNVIYKLVSKYIVNRLKPILHAIISSNQCFSFKMPNYK